MTSLTELKLPTGIEVARLHEPDAHKILELCQGNPLYYESLDRPPSLEWVLGDFGTLPPGRTLEDKLYLGFYQSDALCAVLDIVFGYPCPHIAYIGFFMVAAPVQGRGLGSELIAHVLAWFGALGYARVRLGVVEGNPQAKAFWTKCGFDFTGESGVAYGKRVLAMERSVCE